MRNYITIIFILLNLFLLINIKKFKSFKNFKTFVNILAVIQLSFAVWIFYIDNEVIVLNLIDGIEDKFTNLFLHSHKVIPNELKP